MLICFCGNSESMSVRLGAYVAVAEEFVSANHPFRKHSVTASRYLFVLNLMFAVTFPSWEVKPIVIIPFDIASQVIMAACLSGVELCRILKRPILATFPCGYSMFGLSRQQNSPRSTYVGVWLRCVLLVMALRGLTFHSDSGIAHCENPPPPHTESDCRQVHLPFWANCSIVDPWAYQECTETQPVLSNGCNSDCTCWLHPLPNVVDLPLEGKAYVSVRAFLVFGPTLAGFWWMAVKALSCCSGVSAKMSAIDEVRRRAEILERQAREPRACSTSSPPEQHVSLMIYVDVVLVWVHYVLMLKTAWIYFESHNFWFALLQVCIGAWGLQQLHQHGTMWSLWQEARMSRRLGFLTDVYIQMNSARQAVEAIPTLALAWHAFPFATPFVDISTHSVALGDPIYVLLGNILLSLRAAVNFAYLYFDLGLMEEEEDGMRPAEKPAGYLAL